MVDGALRNAVEYPQLSESFRGWALDKVCEPRLGINLHRDGFVTNRIAALMRSKLDRLGWWELGQVELIETEDFSDR